MQETQKPNKEIERLEDESSTLGLLVTTVKKREKAISQQARAKPGHQSPMI